MNNKQELAKRVTAKKKKLEARLIELKADSRSAAREESRRIEQKLDELQKTVKNGWDDLTEAVAGQLNDWLEDKPQSTSRAQHA